MPDQNVEFQYDLSVPNPNWKALATLTEDEKGVVLLGHSESDFYSQQAALINPASIKRIVSIEGQCPPLTLGQI
ncbi:MAG: hypothetical protein M3294_03975 [Pseudomonadota bacterium]|nr:hypothetical protein [Pseudomonadota bacterium]